jgi:hypothetical protein
MIDSTIVRAPSPRATTTARNLLAAIHLGGSYHLAQLMAGHKLSRWSFSVASEELIRRCYRWPFLNSYELRKASLPSAVSSI